jgi:pyruvate dehydrogenase E2 component (dihydrolipoamide acetyltransferase)
MPKWGIEMTEGTITGWRVRVGERIERGAEILDVETEKIVNAVESPSAGVLRRIVADSGDTRAVGALIGVIAAEDISEAEVTRFIDSFVGAVVSFEPEAEAPARPSPVSASQTSAPALAQRDGSREAAQSGESSQSGEEARVSPIARRVAERLGVDLSQVTGTGRNGRISKEDVEAFAARGAANSRATSDARAATNAPAQPPPADTLGQTVRRLRMSARRVTIARRLTESKQTIPHFRLDIDVDFGPLLRAKRELAETGRERVTVNDLLLRAVALALVQHPMVNAQLDGEDILQFATADIAIAVAAEAGLVTPIVRDANLKSVATIARESRDLVARARQGTLQREEITGGSFTISNLGMYGVNRFDAIINLPQVAILAVAAALPRAVVQGGVMAIADVATLTLSVDHRVVDGAVGAAFLATLRQLVCEPSRLM